MNIKKYYLYRIFEDLVPVYPLYLLMFESEGLSVARISLLLAIWSIPSVLLEIPTGILGDRWSRKNLIVLGALLKALCYFTWMVSDSFPVFALGFVFWGISGAFCSGAEEALLYDSLKMRGEDDKFDLVLGRGHFLSGVSNILAAVSGGFIGMWLGYQPALALSVCSGVVTAGIAFSMKEVNLYKERLAVRQAPEKEDTLKHAFFLLLKNRNILLFTLLGLLAITTAGVLDEYDQLIAKGYGLSAGAIGIWSAIRFVLMAAGSIAARGIRIILEKLAGRRNRMHTVGLLCIIAAIFLVIAGSVKYIGIMLLYGLYYLLMSAGEVLQEDYVQHKIEEEGRSTVHSLISLSKNLYGIVCCGLFGLAVSRTDLFQGLIWCGIYIIICTVVIISIDTVFKAKGRRQM